MYHFDFSRESKSLKNKPFMVMHSKEFSIRNANMADLDALVRLEELAWAEDARADRDTYILRLKTFPEGILIGERNGEIEGAVVTQLISSDMLAGHFTWSQITDGGKIANTHNPLGDVIYGVNLSVKPSHMYNGVILALMNAIATMAIKRNLKFGALGGRLPGLRRYLKKINIDFANLPNGLKDKIVEEYIFGNTKYNRPLDPEIAMYRHFDLMPIRPLRNYFTDYESMDYGVLLIWVNPFFDWMTIVKSLRLFGCRKIRIN